MLFGDSGTEAYVKIHGYPNCADTAQFLTNLDAE